MSRFFAYILFLILVAQPLSPIFASELDSEPLPLDTHEPEVVVESTEASPESEEEIILPETEAVTDESLTVEESAPDTMDSVVAEPDTVVIDGVESLGVSPDLTIGATTTEGAESDDGIVQEVVASTTTEEIGATSTPEMSIETESPQEDIEESESTTIATSTSDIGVEEIVIEEQESTEHVIVATTTEPDMQSATATVPVQVQPTAFAQDLNLKSFPKEACITTGDGMFYCKEPTDAAGILGSDRVFSAPDNEGDKEIFVERDGEVTQISFNQYDDASPRFDEISNTLVWHRLIEGRYQIIRYDIETEEEIQLTNDLYNNMEPSQYGAVVTWQGWVGTDWEIMLWEKGSTTMLTDNTIQDVAPRVMGDYILWESYEDGAWRVKVYDQRSKIIETIANVDGASVDNPRFVLVYDTKYANGDIETRGYDLDTGKTVPLSATPVQTPQDLPSPDQTGEDRALVQPPVSVKTKSATTTDSGDGDNQPDTVGTTTPSDIIITPFVDEIGASTTLPVFENDDLVSAATTTGESIVPDLIITPFVEEISSDIDPQVPVATST